MTVISNVYDVCGSKDDMGFSPIRDAACVLGVPTQLFARRSILSNRVNSDFEQIHTK